MDDTFNCSITNVTFEPGARNSWHKHPGGQLLLVTGGKGYFQEEGQPARVIKEGDVVKINPSVKHWHGAGPDSWLAHIAIGTNPQKGDLEWLEPVTDKEYQQLVVEALNG
jgi:quercetin dioxygenase-like cupin family protein